MTRLEFATMLLVCLAAGACSPKAGIDDRGTAVVPGNAAVPPAGADTQPAARTAPLHRPGAFVPRRFIDIDAAPVSGTARPGALAI